MGRLLEPNEAVKTGGGVGAERQDGEGKEGENIRKRRDWRREKCREDGWNDRVKG